MLGKDTKLKSSHTAFQNKMVQMPLKTVYQLFLSLKTEASPYIWPNYFTSRCMSKKNYNTQKDLNFNSQNCLFYTWVDMQIQDWKGY